MGISLSTGEGILFLLEGDLYFYWRGICISTGNEFCMFTGGEFVFLLEGYFVFLLEGDLYFSPWSDQASPPDEGRGRKTPGIRIR